MSIAVSGEITSSLLPSNKITRKIQKDPAQLAAAAGLVYINCRTEPGYNRKKAGKGYYYVDEQGQRCTDSVLINRFKALVLPPAWKDVWISKNANAHLQATGIDEAGRKQYRYHEHWTQISNYTKYFKLLRFSKVLPGLREQVQKDLRTHTDSCQKVAALVVRLMEKTSIRIGNQRYRIQNGTLGLTTLDARHVTVKGSTITFSFKGKKSIRHNITVRDRVLARLVKHYKNMPGRRLFQYINSEGKSKPLQASHVNDYIKQHTGGNFSAKDFRTWMGTVTACEYLSLLEAPASQAELKRKLNACFDAVATQLGNTRSVCKRYYVHPSVINAYSTQRLQKYLSKEIKEDPWLSSTEQRVCKLLASFAHPT
jgi:DNA topoisomerase I